MNLQIIKSIDGKAEYVLLPINIYHTLHQQITDAVKSQDHNDYVIFEPGDYVDNPIALARIKAGMTQEELAHRIGVSQAYISKIEKQHAVTAKQMQKFKHVLKMK